MNRKLKILTLITCLLSTLLATGCGSTSSVPKRTNPPRSQRPHRVQPLSPGSSTKTSFSSYRVEADQQSAAPGHLSEPAYQITQKIYLWNNRLQKESPIKGFNQSAVYANQCLRLSHSRLTDVVLQEEECYDVFAQLRIEGLIYSCVDSHPACLVSDTKLGIAAFENLLIDNMEIAKVDHLSKQSACYRYNFAPEPGSSQYLAAYGELLESGEHGNRTSQEAALSRWASALRKLDAYSPNPKAYLLCNPNN